jgi:hypothetical protein
MKIAHMWFMERTSLKRWPRASRMRRASGGIAWRSAAVASGCHCWWKRGASTASWMFMP